MDEHLPSVRSEHKWRSFRPTCGMRDNATKPAIPKSYIWLRGNPPKLLFTLALMVKVNRIWTAIGQEKTSQIIVT